MYEGMTLSTNPIWTGGNPNSNLINLGGIQTYVDILIKSSLKYTNIHKKTSDYFLRNIHSRFLD